MYLSEPEKPLEAKLEYIPKLMDTFSDAFFLNRFQDYDAASQAFWIKSAQARGSVIPFMVSYVVKKDLLDLRHLRVFLASGRHLQAWAHVVQRVLHLVGDHGDALVRRSSRIIGRTSRSSAAPKDWQCLRFITLDGTRCLLALK